MRREGVKWEASACVIDVVAESAGEMRSFVLKRDALDRVGSRWGAGADVLVGD